MFVIGFMSIDVLFLLIQGRRDEYDAITLCTLHMLLIKWADIHCFEDGDTKGDSKRVVRWSNWSTVLNILLQTLQNVIHVLVL
jgi:hypothetical protein